MSESRQYQRKGLDEASDLAIAGLQFLADDQERLARFLELSGLRTEDIRTAAARPGFLAGVMGHIMADDRLAAAFAAAEGLAPEELAKAAALLGATWERDHP
jgi:hypothetical protein